MAILEVKNISKVYSTRFGSAKVQALTNMNFSVEEGSMSRSWESPDRARRRC